MGEGPGPFGTLSIGLLPDAVESGFHCVKTHWIRGFMAFRLVRRTRTVVWMVPVWPESGFLGRAYPARRTPRKRAAEALSPVSAPMTARVVRQLAFWLTCVGVAAMFQIPVATSTAKATQPTVSIPLSSGCRSLCGGLGPEDITALETVSAMTSPGW